MLLPFFSFLTDSLYCCLFFVRRHDESLFFLRNQKHSRSCIRYCFSYILTSAQTSESCTAEEKKSKKKRAPLRLYDRHLQARLLNEAERASIEYVRTIRTRQYNGTFCFGYGVSGKVCKFYRFIPDNCQKSSGLNPECIRYIRKTGNASCFLRMPDKKSEFLFQYSCRKENEALKIKIFCPRKQKLFAKIFPDIILI